MQRLNPNQFSGEFNFVVYSEGGQVLGQGVESDMLCQAPDLAELERRVISTVEYHVGLAAVPKAYPVDIPDHSIIENWKIVWIIDRKGFVDARRA